MTLHLLLTMALCLTAACDTKGADEPTLTAKVSRAALPAEVSDDIGKLLSTDAIEVRDAAGPAVTFWLRKSLPTEASAEQIRNGLTYAEVTGGSVVGVVSFASTWTDFRRQEVVAGVYTLRIAVQPATGDHMGTAPHTDFCLLTPVAKDTKAAAIELKALVEQSKEVTGGTHPSVMLLFPNFKGEGPKVTEEKDEVLVLRTKLDVGDGKAKLGFGFAVAGVTKK